MTREQLIKKLQNKEIDTDKNMITMEDVEGLTRDEVVQILEEDHNIITDYAEEYGEPGYENNGKTILFGDWNYISNEVFEWLEEEYNLEWLDEWIVNYNDSVAFRTQPNSWGWMQSFFLDDESEPIAIKGNEKEYIETGDFINNCHSIVANVDEETMKKLGFIKIDQDDHCSGWYAHCEMPCDFIEKNIPQELIDNNKIEYVFYSEGKGQFAISWSVWVRAEKDVLIELGILKEGDGNG
jgi:hypothetical protein